MVSGKIVSMERFSIHDGPGVRTSVFFCGCPLHCIWCHNPESWQKERILQYIESDCIQCGICEQVCPNTVHHLADGRHQIDRSKCIGCMTCVEHCPADALKMCGQLVSADQVMEEIRKDKSYYGEDGGVTLSGGEPLFQPEFAEELLTRCKKEGISTCVETAGFVAWSVFERIRDQVDLFLFDYKLDTQDEMDRYTGGSIDVILGNLKKLANGGAKIGLRCPIIPGINDGDAHFAKIADIAKELGIAQTELMMYHNFGAGKWQQIGKPYALEGLETVSSRMAAQYREKLAYYMKQ